MSDMTVEEQLEAARTTINRVDVRAITGEAWVVKWAGLIATGTRVGIRTADDFDAAMIGSVISTQGPVPVEVIEMMIAKVRESGE